MEKYGKFLLDGFVSRGDQIPIAPGLTPHGLRRSHRTLLEELGRSPVLADERSGHTDGSVQRRYTHVTDDMRAVWQAT